MLIKNWYIIATTDELKHQHYISKTLLNTALIIGKRQNGSIFAIEDRCCHRNVALSLGEYKDDVFTCGYHGWKYNSDGKCIEIPSLKGKLPTKARVQSFPLKIEHGFIWITLSAHENTIFQFKELLNDPFIYTKHQFKGDLKFVSESLFDPFHINHVHKHSIKSFMGDLKDELIDLEFETTDKSLVGSYNRVNNGTFFEKKYFGNEPLIKTEFEFHFPNISKLKIIFPKRTLTIYEHICEVKPNVIEMIQITSWSNIFKGLPIAHFLMKKISDKIVKEDIDFFKSHFELNQEKTFSDVHVKSDQLSLAFRKIWAKQMEEN